MTCQKNEKKRNYINTARDLVYVHSNLRLMDNLKSLDYQETTVQWEEWGLSEDDASESEYAEGEVD